MSNRLSEQLWSRLFSDPSGVRAFPEARRVPLTLIDPNPDQPRHALAGIEELAAHIKEYELLQPVVLADPAEGRYTLIAGHRRYAAFDWLSTHDAEPERWQDIPAVVRRVNTAERLVLAVSENVSRHNLTDAEVLTAIRLLRDLHRWSQAEIARRLGVSRQWISQYFQAADNPELAEHVQTGRLSTAKAYEVQRAKSPEAREAALEAALSGASLRDVRSIAGSAAEQASGDSTERAAPTRVGGPASGSGTAAGASSGRQKPAGRQSESEAPAGPPQNGSTLEERAEHAPDVDLGQFRTTALVRGCLSRGSTKVRAASLLQALRDDLAKLEALLSWQIPPAGPRPGEM